MRPGRHLSFELMLGLLFCVLGCGYHFANTHSRAEDACCIRLSGVSNLTRFPGLDAVFAREIDRLLATFSADCAGADCSEELNVSIKTLSWSPDVLVGISEGTSISSYRVETVFEASLSARGAVVWESGELTLEREFAVPLAATGAQGLADWSALSSTWKASCKEGAEKLLRLVEMKQWQ